MEGYKEEKERVVVVALSFISLVQIEHFVIGEIWFFQCPLHHIAISLHSGLGIFGNKPHILHFIWLLGIKTVKSSKYILHYNVSLINKKQFAPDSIIMCQ